MVQFSGKLTQESPQDVGNIEKLYFRDTQKYKREYLDMLRKTTLIQGYSLFEHFSLLICDIAKDRIKSSVSASDLKGQDYELHREYLKKVVNLDLAFLNEFWSALNNWRIVRNLIVHNHSNVKKDHNQQLEKQKYYGTVKGSKAISLENNGSFSIIDDEYVTQYLYFSQNYLREILRLVLNVKQKRIRK